MGLVSADIRYPYAIDENGAISHISDSPSKRAYTCTGCGAQMVAKHGSVREEHFAHKPPYTAACSGVTALHKAAQAVVVDGFNRAAKTDGAKYTLGTTCKEHGCEDIIEANYATRGRWAESEKSVVKGTVSDVVVRRPGYDPVIIEIVVTHDIDRQTHIRYEESGYPVIVIYVRDWPDVLSLGSGAIADKMINGPDRCEACDNRLRRRAKECLDAHIRADRIIHDMGRNSSQSGITPWYNDKFGAPMTAATLSKVNRTAKILSRAGLTQHNRAKPWLFRYPISDRNEHIYADLGGTDIIGIWEDPSAAVYCFTTRGFSDLEEVCLTHAALKFFRDQGAEVRLHFESHIKDDDDCGYYECPRCNPHGP